MQIDLCDEVAVVVGGAGTIGLAIAQAFARCGAHVALLDQSPRVEDCLKELPLAAGARAWANRCDVTQFEAVASAAAEIESRLRRVDHVVFAAAIGSGKFGFPFWNLQPEDWNRVWQVNVQGGVHVAHAFAPLWIQRRQGTLTFISSVAGQIGSQSDPPYSAAKAALLNFAQCAAKDLAAYSVRVNSVCPGMVQTPLNRSVWAAWNAQQPPAQQQSYEQWAGDKVAKMCPLGRWQTPQDVAAMCVFLASNLAQNITGQALNVDGGWVMHA